MVQYKPSQSILCGNNTKMESYFLDGQKEKVSHDIESKKEDKKLFCNAVVKQCQSEKGKLFLFVGNGLCIAICSPERNIFRVMLLIQNTV